MPLTDVSRPHPGKVAWVPASLMIVAHLGALLAFVPAFFSWKAVLVAVFLHWLTGGIGICMTYHRLLTHRSFVCRPKWLEYVLTAIGCCAVEGGAISWVSVHRRHHAHSDQEEDLHSPNRGFGWAHMLWWIVPETPLNADEETTQKWAPDLLSDPVHVFLDRWNLVFPALLAVTLFAIGGLPWLVWGGFVRTVAVLHSTWLINSAAHIWGYRSHQTRDRSRNLWWVALLTYGEGWHNNHHAFPTSARHGLRWWEIDMTHWAIIAMRTVGLARSVKRPRITRPEPEPVRPEPFPAAT